ncbi:tigger transposable element-derived protein 4-like [Ornithodoros turicata]|uniref:tigger transposable element-derived protein 4-like n=1 Tax=Ornithodoros turicata TaxID=34597 RepID=UPI003138B44D
MSKRACQSIPLETKVAILSEVNSGKLSKTEIAKKFGIPKSTLSGIVKDKTRILESFNNGGFGPKRKRMRTAAHRDLEDVLVTWIQRARSANLPVNGPVLRAKGEEIATRLDIEFSCSDGWMDRFRKRHGLVFRSVVGEAAAVDETVCQDWRSSRLRQLLEEYDPADVYNADETALYYQLLPDKTLTFVGDTCTGGKHSKVRITVLVGANMSGTDKLKLLVIGKAKSPRCFKHVKTLPVDYTANSKSWMTQALFEQWLRGMDRRFVREKRKVLFLVDNCPGHGDVAGLSAIRLEFLPPNTTAKLQPMDQGVISSLKRHYRRSLLQRMLLCMETEKDYQVNLLSALHLLARAWDMVTETTIANSFRHAGFLEHGMPAQNLVEDSEGMQEDSGLLSNLRNAGVSVDIESYITLDEDVATCRQDTMDAIIEEVLHTDEPSNTEVDEDEDCDVEVAPVTCDAAESALSVLLQFFQEREGSERYLSQIGQMSSFVTGQHLAGQRQQKLTEWFS